jgi:hypothetical protein
VKLIRRSRTEIAGWMVCAVVAWCCAEPAAAQSLRLTYSLHVRSDTSRTATEPVRLCGGTGVVEAIVGCSRELLSVIRANVLAYGAASPAPHAAEAAPPNEVTQAVRAVPLQEVAPTRADSLEARARTGNSGRTPDLSLKFGRKTAATEDEASRDLPRFTDTTYETHVQNNARKTLGVELLVPFH